MSSFTSDLGSALPSSSATRGSLRGHKGPVNCLRRDGDLLGSGGEDGVVRMWDLRVGRGVRCVKVGEAVTGLVLEGDKCWVSSGGRVGTFDLRGDAVVVEGGEWTEVVGGEDEVNGVSVIKGRKGETRGVVCDDLGTCHILDPTIAYKAPERLGGHSEDAVLTKVEARPQGTDFVSGGTDCRVCLWDGGNPRGARKPLGSVVMEADATENTAQAFNPPFILSLAWLDRNRVAAGCGDGTISVMQVTTSKPRSLAKVRTLSGGHGKGIGALASRGEEKLVSGGNEGNVVLWDLARPNPLIAGVINEGGGPNDVEVGKVHNEVLVADCTNDIGIYTFR